MLAVMGGWTIGRKIFADRLSATANPNRVRYYVATIFYEWLLLVLVVAGVRRSGASVLIVLGEHWHSVRQVLRDIGIGVGFWIVAAMLLWIFGWLLRTAALGRNVSMLPQRGIELTLWIALSVTAGICEETIFRRAANPSLRQYLATLRDSWHRPSFLGGPTFVLFVAAAIWFWGGGRNPYITRIGVLCALVGGFPIFHEAYENIVQRRMTMELSMAIAIVAALAIREIFTALVITLFVLVAEILEGLTVGRGRTAIRHLVGLLPTTATVRRNETWQEVETKEIAVGEIVLVKPGTRIPVDGVVVGGHSFVDQATITGESMPTEKSNGTSVYAGTINQSGALEIRVERAIFPPAPRHR
jgi:hypothetical protein